MTKARWLILVLAVLVAAGYVGVKYFNNFNNFSANPICVHDCWENGKRVR
jgi:hypothetical protein